MRSILQIVLSIGLSLGTGWGQAVSITSLGSPVTQNFDTLANTAGSTTNSVLPAGWAISEAGGGARDNEQYAEGSGSSNTGDSYSFGATGSTDRAIGQLRSGTLISTIGAAFTNNSGSTIASIAIAYIGEQWRLGAVGRVDRMNFEYSLDAVSLTTGTWMPVSGLNFTAPTTGPTAGALNGNAAENRTSISSTISSLTIPNGATFWIRWTDTDATGADDGLGIDDFSLTASATNGGTVCPTITVSPASLPAGTQNASYSQILSAAGGTSPYTFSVTAGAPPAGLTLESGTLSGIPSVSGSVNFSVTATDASLPTGCTGTQQYSLLIAPPVTLTNINAIQGAGSISALAGQTISTSGIVTAVVSNGFFLQNREEDYDANPNTSEGLFVFTSSAPPSSAVAGNRVQVSGTVIEFAPSTDPNSPKLTELTGVTVSQLSTGNTLPLPQTIDAAIFTPGGGLEQLERFEGMRVAVASMTVVAPTDGSTNEANAAGTSNGVFYGTLTGVATPFREAGIQAPNPVPTCAAGSSCNIPVFDNNPERLRVDSDRVSGNTALDLRVGQTLTNLVGVLDYAFRAYQLNLDNSSQVVVSGTGVTEGMAPLARASEVTVATYNLERFFDTVNDAGVSDSVLTVGAFNSRLNKLSLAVRNNLGAPDVIGFQEVENLSTLQTIADRVTADAGGAYAYSAYLVEGNDIGGIDVGFLVKNSVTVSSVTQYGKTDTYTSPCTNAQEILNDRPPLMLKGVVTRNGRVLDLIVIANHLRSLNGVDDTTPCPSGSPVSTDGERVRAKRAGQAEFLANLVQTEQSANPNAKIIVLGDMNAFDVNDGLVDVIGTVSGNPSGASFVAKSTNDLVNPNLSNLLQLIPDAGQRFSYVFDGNHQTLDHLLYSQGLAAQVTNGGYVRINSEFAEVDRNNSNSPRRLSDHDPGVIYLTTAQQLTSGVLVQRAGLILNRTTNTYNGNLFIRNTGTAALTGPFTIAVTGLPTGVTMVNATGSNYQGSFIVNGATTLAPGGTLVVPVQFSNPANLPITYLTKVYSGAF